MGRGVCAINQAVPSPAPGRKEDGGEGGEDSYSILSLIGRYRPKEGTRTCGWLRALGRKERGRQV